MTPTPDITETLVQPLSSRITTATFEAKGAKYDVAVGDLPFIISPRAERPYIRQTAESRRQQIDTSAEPGEQTLSQWWTRSQDSWHRGAGIKFYEPGSDETTVNRFAASQGIDPWTKGELRLQRKRGSSFSVSSGQASFVLGGVKADGTDVVFAVLNTVTGQIDTTNLTGYVNTTGKTPITPLAKAGSTLLVGHTAGILKFTAATPLSELWTISSGAVVTPYWVKSRIIASRGPKLYELPLAGGAITEPTNLLYTHPDTAWTWSGVVEAPNAILAAGYSNGQGVIYRFKLVDATTSGGSPTIGSAEVVAEFPPGEEVTGFFSYLGTFLAIGTSKGVRIGVIGADSSVNYGPLLFETVKPVRCFTARDRFVYAAVQDDPLIDGSFTGAVRIDLSTQVEELRFAWATDFNARVTGVPTGITFLGNTDRVVMAVTGQGIFMQHATQFETSGWIKTGKIRLATSVGKVFPLAQIRGSATSTSTIRIATVVDGVENNEFTIGQAFNTDADVTLSTAERVLPNLELKLVFTSSSDHTVSPVVDTVTLKALPQVRVQRVIQYPLLLQDFEHDRNNVQIGGPGAAWQRLQELEDLEGSKTLVPVTDMRTGETYRGWITQVQFVNETPPERGKANFGGFLMLTVTRM